MSTPSLPHHFYNHPFPPLSVEFRVVDLLPGPEIQFAVGHGEKYFMMDQQTFQVGIAVRFASAMVPVVPVERRNPFQPVVNILNQAVFGIIHVDPRGDVHRRNENHPFRDSTLPNYLLNVIRDVDVLARLLRREPEIFGQCFHGS